MALLMTLRRMGRDDLTTHGFRSTFRDWAAEQIAYASEICEMALASWHFIEEGSKPPHCWSARRKRPHITRRGAAPNQWPTCRCLIVRKAALETAHARWPEI